MREWKDPDTRITYKYLQEPEEVEQYREAIEDCYEGWFLDSPRIDWQDFYDRLETTYHVSIDELDTPVDKKVRAIVREVRAQT